MVEHERHTLRLGRRGAGRVDAAEDVDGPRAVRHPVGRQQLADERRAGLVRDVMRSLDWWNLMPHIVADAGRRQDLPQNRSVSYFDLKKAGELDGG